MTIAVVFPLVGILVRVSSLEVEVGEEGSVVTGKHGGYGERAYR